MSRKIITPTTEIDPKISIIYKMISALICALVLWIRLRSPKSTLRLF